MLGILFFLRMADDLARSTLGNLHMFVKCLVELQLLHAFLAAVGT